MNVNKRKNPFLRTTFLLMIAISTQTMGQNTPLFDPDLYITNGYTNAMRAVDNTLYLGGGFSMVGPYSGHGVVFNTTTGAWEKDWPQFTGMVNVVISDNNGGWFVGGDFTAAGNQPQNRIAHVRADKTIAPNFSPVINKSVQSLLLWNNKLYIGGLFDEVDGQERKALACYDLKNDSLTNWNPVVNRLTMVGQVYSILARDTTLLVGGVFYNIGGKDRAAIAELDTVTGNATDWAVQEGSIFGDQIIYDMVLDGNNLYVGGQFFGMADSSRKHFAAIDFTTAEVLPLNFSFDQYEGPNLIYDLELAGSDLYVAGGFVSVSGQSANGIAKINLNNNTVENWDPAISGFEIYVHGIAIEGTTMYFAGEFTSVGGEPRIGLASINLSDASLTNWNPAPGSQGTTVYTAQGKLFAGGRFSLMNGIERKGLAALDLSTGQPTNWAPELSGYINDMLITGETIYIAGYIQSIDSSARKNIAAFKLTDGSLLDWAPDVNSTIEALEYYHQPPDGKGNPVAKGHVLIGGSFSQVNGVSKSYLASIDSASGDLNDWSPDPSSTIKKMALHGEYLYVTGWFTSIGGYNRKYVAATNIFYKSANDFDPSPNSAPQDIYIHNNTVYIAGSFTEANGTAVKGFAAFDINNNHALKPLAPNARFIWNDNEQNPNIYSIRVHQDKLFLGGFFNYVGDSLRNGLAAFDTLDGALSLWDAKLERGSSVPAVRTMVSDGASLYIGGDMQSSASFGHEYFMRITDFSATSIESAKTDIAPIQFSLKQNYPNPFNPVTTISYTLPKTSAVKLSIYDNLGRLILSQEWRKRPGGTYHYNFNGLSLASGTYYYRLQTDFGVQVKRMTLIK
jgi:Secretion system C-terminal sorting domain/Domain of unknown function (DUF5122) beta-propeller